LYPIFWNFGFGVRVEGFSRVNSSLCGLEKWEVFIEEEVHVLVNNKMGLVFQSFFEGSELSKWGDALNT
jgi:hypothetical protein